eukprot:GEMP01030323.1.p1 GENE.GEMP01030323.1~~GEMP01030323.1.p1  ORF type:complete len:267 (-),score=53.23 GEMP01030323.1:1302-2102(-)
MLPSRVVPSTDVNHLTAQEYTNWKFKSTGRYEKAIGHFYGKFETTDGCLVPSGLFHDKHVIHVPGQAPTAPMVIARDPSKFYGQFTTKDGYQVPPGHFHSPEVVAVTGQAMDMHISAVSKPSPNSVPSPLKETTIIREQPAHLDCKDVQGTLKPGTPDKLSGQDCRATTAHSSAASTPSQTDRQVFPSSPPNSFRVSRVSRARSPEFRSRLSRAQSPGLPKAAVGFTSPKREPRGPVVVSRPSLMSVPALQAPRFGMMLVNAIRKQ